MTNGTTLLDDRGIVRVSGEDAASFSKGSSPTTSSGSRPARRATPGCCAARQDPVRHDRCARPADSARRISSTAPPRRRPISPSASASTSCARGSRLPTRAPPRSRRFLGRRAGERRPAARLRRSARSAARLSRDLPRAEAAAFGDGRTSDLRGAAHRARRAQGRRRFRLWRRLSPRRQHGSAQRRRFRKGCYVGQEVVSRMKHRGGGRKRIVRVRLDGARRRRERRSSTASCRSARWAPRRAARRSRCCGSTGSRRRRPAGAA